MSYDEVRKSNELFENFYNDLDIVPDSDERKQFWAAMRRELPNSFRFTGSKGYGIKLLKSVLRHANRES